MEPFTIIANKYLNRNCSAFYHTDFYGYNKPNNPDFLNILKNDPHQGWSQKQLTSATEELKTILLNDLPEILRLSKYNSLLVCVVPRAKSENTYIPNQKLFKATIKTAINQFNNLDDGTNYILRHTNTKTTHLRAPSDKYINDGEPPYVGITAKTCQISGNVKGKNILLIDDIYTKTVNIDEDVIQTLLNNGANSVTFYAIAKTVQKY
jgi:hypothetical protein